MPLRPGAETAPVPVRPPACLLHVPACQPTPHDANTLLTLATHPPTLPCSRDLKSKNVLLTRDLRAKVADVGGAALHSATYMSGAPARLLCARCLATYLRSLLQCSASNYTLHCAALASVPQPSLGMLNCYRSLPLLRLPLAHRSPLFRHPCCSREQQLWRHPGLGRPGAPAGCTLHPENRWVGLWVGGRVGRWMGRRGQLRSGSTQLTSACRA